MVYDLINGRYIVGGLHSHSKAAIQFCFEMDKSEFTPAAIRRSGR